MKARNLSGFRQNTNKRGTKWVRQNTGKKGTKWEKLWKISIDPYIYTKFYFS
jgi:hypothetical protein